MESHSFIWTPFSHSYTNTHTLMSRRADQPVYYTNSAIDRRLQYKIDSPHRLKSEREDDTKMQTRSASGTDMFLSPDMSLSVDAFAVSPLIETFTGSISQKSPAAAYSVALKNTDSAMSPDSPGDSLLNHNSTSISSSIPPSIRSVSSSASLSSFASASSASSVGSTSFAGPNKAARSALISTQSSPAVLQVSGKNAAGKYPCKECSRSYLHAKHLKRHMLRRKFLSLKT